MKTDEKDNEFRFFGFSCDSRMEYFTDEYKTNYRKSGYVDRVFFGIHDRRGGTRFEMSMVWYDLDDKPTPKFEVFSEAMAEVTKPWHKKMMKKVVDLGNQYFTSDEFSRVLISLGFEDMSDYKLI